MTATRTRRRKQPVRLGPHPAGSDAAIRIVRLFIASEERRRREGEAWRAVLKALEQPRRRRLL